MIATAVIGTAGALATAVVAFWVLSVVMTGADLRNPEERRTYWTGIAVLAAGAAAGILAIWWRALR